MAKNILLFTGDGKGKSTAAFGMAVRAAGHDQRVLIIQFIKSDAAVGELAGLRLLGIALVQTGRGFVPGADSSQYAAHRAAAQAGLKLADEALQSGDYDLVVLDEICGAVAKGLLDEQAVVAAIEAAPEPINIVLTGRGASAGLIALADTASEVRPLKHALEQGIAARKGVEF